MNAEMSLRGSARGFRVFALLAMAAPAGAAGLKVDRIEAQGANASPFEAVEVQFNQPVMDGTFDVSDIVAFTGPGGAVAVANVTKVTPQRYRIDATGTSNESYTLELGPDIRDAANDPLDQDGDGAPGEVADDVYRARLISDNSTIAGGNATFDGHALLFAIGNATVQGDHTFAHVEAQRGALPVFANATALGFRSVRVEGASSLRIGGGATVAVSGNVAVAGNSELRLRARDNTGPVSGNYIGAGVTLTALHVTVGTGSNITADGEGYVNGSGPGYTGQGAAHGGRGDNGSGGFSGQPTYGDAFEPIALGGGGSVFNAGSLGGGAIRLIVSGTLTLDGELTADGVAGGQVFQGPSGGSVWVTAATLTGAGRITADGAAGGGGGAPGAGGRAAVYYATDGGFGGFQTSTVASGGGVAQKGTLVFIDTGVADGAARVSQRFAIDAETTTAFGSLVIDNGGLFEIGGNGTLDVEGALSVTGNSSLRVFSSNRTAQVLGQWVGRGGTILSGTLAVAFGSNITADAEGYVNSTGPGYNSNDGGAHGGRGASGSGPGPIAPYGDAFAPIELGSGANAFNNTYVAGGGAIRIVVDGLFQNDGEVSADAFGTGGAQEGAAGGSIWITAGSLGGNGVFTADGEAGGDNRNSGAGGRIAVYYNALAGFTGFLGSTVAAGGPRAEKGSLIFVDYSVPGGSYRVSQRLLINSDATANFGALTIDNGALFEMNGGATVHVAGPMALTGNSTLRVHSKNRDGLVAGQWVGRGGTIAADSLTVAAGSAITADGEGYYNSRGPGYNTNAGGSHGGIGAQGSAALLYGDAFAPIELGSGGNAFNNTFVAGGGAIRLTVSGTLTLDGEISADAFGTGGAHDGASGGSIWATVGTLAGSGLFTANGTKGGDPGRPSGAGGRIAVYYDTDGGFGGFLASQVERGDPNGNADPEHGTLFFARQTADGPEFRVSQRFFVPIDTAMVGRSLTVDNAAQFEIGGNGSVLMSRAVSLLGGSEMRFFGKDTAAAIGGEFVGCGGRLFTGNLVIDPTSKMDADGRGYISNAGPGWGSGGSSHGGLGGNAAAEKLYGNANAPIDLGSSPNAPNPGFGGGAIELIVGGNFTLDGVITADAFGSSFTSTQGYGGSGGSVFVRAGSTAGNGSISADGSSGSDAGAFSGSGGRIALFHAGTQGLAPGNLTVLPGSTGNPPAANGTVVVQPASGRFLLLAPGTGYAHGDTIFDYAGLGYDPETTRATLEVRRASAIFPVGEALGSVGRMSWNSTVMPDGPAELRVVFRDLLGQLLGEGSAPLMVHNAAEWHGGRIVANQTWTANRVHVVETDVLVPSGVVLTIEAGAIVKFLRGRRIVAQTGGVVDADAATVPDPIVMTSIADDTADGDTNLDGSLTSPRAGDWLGVALDGTGQFLTSASTDIRFARFIRSGTINTQTWPARSLNIVRGDVTVNPGQTLTILPGAVVKFELDRRMVVHGSLNATGTLAQPIAFTSIRDDARGGDTNNDGNTTEPDATDWRVINVVGSAVFDHCFIGYARGESSLDGIIRSEGTTVLRNSTISDGVYSGLMVLGAATVENSIVLRTDRGIDGQSGTATVRHSVMHDNRIGVFAHGTALTVTNSLVTGSSETGVFWLGGTPVPVLSHCDVFGNFANFMNMADPTGSDGNVSVDPEYRDASKDDFRLKYLSPVIDAADGTQTPASDRTGVARYDDPRVANTGVMAPGGAFADIGAFEFVEAAGIASNLDLVVADVSGPSAALAGDAVTVTWTVRNEGSEAIVGPWFDTVALRAAGGALASVFAGEFEIGVGVVLGPGQSFAASASVRVPGAEIGPYEWEVMTNSRGTVIEGANGENNTAGAGSVFQLDLPELVLDAPASNRAFDGAGRPLWFKVVPGSGKQVLATLDLAGNGVTELFVRRGSLPTAQTFELRSTQFGSPDPSLTIGGTQPQVYYVLANPVVLTGSPQAFSIRAQTLALGLQSLTTNRIAGTGNVTIGFNGALLSPGGTYELVGPGGTVAAGTITPADLSRVFATFTLNGLTPGAYTARVTVGGDTVELVNAVTVEPPPSTDAEQIRVDINMPTVVRAGREASVTLEVRNVGNVDVYAPLLRVTVQGWAPRTRLELGSARGFASAAAGGGGGGRVVAIEIVEIFIAPPPQPEQVRKQFVVIPLNPENPAGILPPGFRSQIVLDGVPELDADSISIVVDRLKPNEAFDFNAMKAAAKPDTMPQQAWDVIFANFVSALGGNTTAGNVALADSATYLADLGQRTSDLGRLLGWEFAKAGHFGEIQRRWTLGPFGYGSVALTPTASVTVEPDFVGGVLSNATVFTLTTEAGSRRRFRKGASDSQFRAEGLGNGTITETSPERFELVEFDNTRFVYEPRVPGNLSLLQPTELRSPAGNTGNFSYDGAGRVLGFAGEFGSMSYGYNPAGRVSSITDLRGGVTTFGYDALNEHLTTITVPSGLTSSIEYFLGEGAEKEHAVKRMTFSDGSIVDFEYDARGRPMRTRRNGQQPLTYTYDSQGAITTTDAENSASTVRIDPQLRPVRMETEGVAPLELERDERGTLLSMRTADQGGGVDWTPDINGLPTLARDPLGNEMIESFDPGSKRITSHTDRRGATTQIGYDLTAGRFSLGAIDFPDGTRMSFAHDNLGRVTGATNGRNQTITFDYNAAGDVSQRTFPDGTFDVLTYAPVTRRLLSIERHAGAQVFTTNFNYDASGRTARIEYPGGRALNYLYDAAGRKTQVTSDDGYEANYDYDAVGRLERVRDGLGQMVVEYGYDTTGRPNQRRMANGIVSNYTFTPSGRIASVITRRPDASVLSSFEYNFNSIDQITGATTPAGNFTYEYDLNGQLTVIHAPGDRIIRYTYDAEGNRLEVDDDGVVTPYTPNYLNQYTSVGSGECFHDSDGNLITRTQGGQTTTFSYAPEGRLTGSDGAGGTWTYEYDVLGNLAAITENGVRTEFLVDPIGFGDVLAEYGPSGTTRYFHGNGLTSQVTPGGTSSFLFDGNGHASALVNAAGVVENSYAWLPFGEAFGNPVEAVSTRFKFAGAYGGLSAGAGIVQLRARGYDPALGRFLSRDRGYLPLGNAYVYCGNNPIGTMDRTGEDGEWYNAAWSDAPTAWSNVGLLTDAIGVGLPHLASAAGAISRGLSDAAIAAGSNGGRLWNLALGVAAIGDDCKPAAAALGKIGAVGNVLLAAQEFYSNAVGMHGSKGALQRMAEGDMFASFDYVNATGTFILKVATAPVPFLSAGIDVTKSFVDQQSLHIFNVFMEPGEPYPEEIFGNVDAYWRFMKGHQARVITSADPNDIVGPDGFDTEMWIDDEGLMHFTVRFENQPTATASAYRVRVELPLHPDMDPSTFAFDRVGFAGAALTAPAGRQYYATRTSVATDPNPVKIVSWLDPSTGLVTWWIESFDAATGELPEDPFAGFLPPNDATGRGEGFVTFTIRPRTGVANPYDITAQASIVFDTNAAILTNTHQNRIETGIPSSDIVALPAVSQAGVGGFLVQWAGNGSFSGFGTFDVYVSDNGGPFSIWQQGTANTSAFFPGVAGHTYGFAVIATDNVGQIESAKTAADAETYVNTPPEAGPDQISRHPTQSAKVLIPTLLSNDSDSDGGAPAFVSVGPGTANGGTVSRSGNWVFYQPPSGGNLTLPDAFAYTINDGQGGVATGAVTVLIANDEGLTLNIVSIAIQPDDRVRIEFVGIPGRAYRVEWSETLAPGGWQNADGTPVEISPGRFEFFDTPPPGANAGFYRAVHP